MEVIAALDTHAVDKNEDTLAILQRIFRFFTNTV